MGLAGPLDLSEAAGDPDLSDLTTIEFTKEKEKGESYESQDPCL